MTAPPPLHPSDWDQIRMVVFDVDGTLYDQRRLRLVMLRDLLAHLLLKREGRQLRVLRTYRRLRERLGDLEAPYREEQLVAETAAKSGATAAEVAEIVAEWIEQRPLQYLAACRYPGVAELFRALRRRNKLVAILSDYPAAAKLAALGLSADHLVSAGADGPGFLKPHPEGLELLLAAAGVRPDQAVMIGDRVERDGEAARRLGVPSLIRSSRSLAGWQTFDAYHAAIFAPLLAGETP